MCLHLEVTTPICTRKNEALTQRKPLLIFCSTREVSGPCTWLRHGPQQLQDSGISLAVLQGCLLCSNHLLSSGSCTSVTGFPASSKHSTGQWAWAEFTVVVFLHGRRVLFVCGKPLPGRKRWLTCTSCMLPFHSIFTLNLRTEIFRLPQKLWNSHLQHLHARTAS